MEYKMFISFGHRTSGSQSQLVALTLLIMCLFKTGQCQYQFTCGWEDSTPRDPGRVFTLEDYQTRTVLPNENVSEAVIPVAILLVDPLQNWIFEGISESVSRTFDYTNEEWFGHDVAFSIGAVEVVTLADYEVRRDYYKENMLVFVIINETSPIVPGGNCGMSSHQDNVVRVRNGGGCGELLGQYTGAFTHELGHNFGLTHTFYGGADDHNDIWTVIGPDGTEIGSTNGWDSTLHEYVDQANYPNCSIPTVSDGLCSTPAEVNPADGGLWDTNGVQFYVRWNDGRLPNPQPGRSLYTPNYPELTWDDAGTIISYLSNEDGSDIPLPPCYMAAVGLLDVNGDPYVDVFSANGGEYNMMTYAGEGCPAHFTQEQVNFMYADLISGNSSPVVQDIMTNLIVRDDGDSDGLENTFSTLEGACDFINHHWMNFYTIFIESDESMGGEVVLDMSLYTGNEVLSSLYNYSTPRYVSVEMIGVVGVNSDGTSPVVRTTDLAIVIPATEHSRIAVHGDVDLTIQGVKFDGFGANRIVDPTASPSATLMEFHGSELSLINCQFSECGLNSGCTSCDLLQGPGGVVHFESQDTSGKLILDNCLFNDNVAVFGDAVAVTMTPRLAENEIYAEVRNCTFVNNSYSTSAVNRGALHAQVVGESQFFECTFAGSDPIHGVPGWQTAISVEPGSQPGSHLGSIDFCLFDQDWWANDFFAGDPRTANNLIVPATTDLGFVNQDLGDYRLRWDSILLDTGDPLSPNDFDLTAADIGWNPVVPTHQISGPVSMDLEAHNYEINVYCMITGTIPPGAAIRTNSGAVLEILVPSAGAEYTIGDIDGPRTAIVGRPTKDSESAASIEFKARTFSSPLAFEGVLFNYPAVNNSVGEMRFNGQSTPQNYTVTLDGDKVDFRNYSNFTVGGGNETQIDAHLAFWYSRGTVSDLDFRMNDGDPANLQVFNSAMTISDCKFKPTTTSGVTYTSPLQIFGMLGGETSHLLRNTFEGSAQQVGPMAHVTQSVQRVKRNEFLDCYTTALRQDFATINMSQEGRNSFIANVDQFAQFIPIVTMDDGDLDLFCGHNNFVVRDAYLGWPIITYTQRFFPGGTHRNWKQNYWGRDCSVEITELEFEDELLPFWAILEDNLSECVPLDAPESPVCENSTITSYQLLKDGINAETEGNFETARGNYFYLLALYPDSKETNEGTLRLKALGLSEGFGSASFEAIRSDLHSVADSSEAVNQHSLAVLQVAGGWCVEALYGDRPAAVAALQAAYTAETDAKCRNILSLAIAEIATYPPQGGMSATGPGMRYALALVQQEAVQALFALQQETAVVAPPSEVSTLPQSFAIARLYPNPFNPTTVIELALPAEGLVKVEVYNLLGQSVATVIHEKLKAGLHPITFDGSTLASGMYLAVAEFEGQSQVRKMLLMK